jgi:aldose 1-epimerase
VWRYDAVQDYALDEAGLAITLAVMNRGVSAMPFGLGLHPWFARHAEALVRFSADGFWLLSPDGEALSLGPVPPEHDHSAPAPLPRHSLNLCYEGWSGTAQVRWPGAGVSLDLRADPVMGRLMVHVPAHDPGTFCLEPQSNPPCGFDWLDAVATGSGLHVLLPGEAVAGRMTMNVSEH